jgi:hypothetical protein
VGAEDIGDLQRQAGHPRHRPLLTQWARPAVAGEGRKVS